MNPRVKKKWIEALRSGEYKQGQQRLKRDDGSYCCLGVLCDLYHKETGKGLWKHVPQDTEGLMFQDGKFKSRSLTGLTQAVCNWAKLSCPFGSLVRRYDNMSLSIMNDYGYTFDQIADVIEENFDEPND